MSILTSSSVTNQMANAVRILTMDSIERAQSGHPGMPMGMADVSTVLFKCFLKFDPLNPEWPDRDRFVLSAGHGAMLLYSLLYLTGYKHMTLDELKAFRKLGSKTPGHPEHDTKMGIETTTGPLGQGLANAVGMALAEKVLAEEFSDLVDHKTYVIVSDGDLMEGISQEAISLAGHWRLNKLIVLFDDNSITIDGPTCVSSSDNTKMRFEACNWAVYSIDGHDVNAIENALKAAQKQDRPTLIACRTVIGYGAPHKAGSSACHGAPLGADEVAAARKALLWPNDEAFFIPENILNPWREVGMQHAQTCNAWYEKLNSSSFKTAFLARLNAEFSFQDAICELKQQYEKSAPSQSTRKSSGEVINKIFSRVPFLIGSADLSESTQVPYKDIFSAETPNGHCIHYGVREHGMAGIMNGISLHGGFIPCGSTFFVFSDYCKPAIRMAALMGLQIIYVMSHDSIGLGEDGSTHQPIEQLASLRAVPNLCVFRPADGVEVAECWENALSIKNTPSVICLTRQAVSAVREVSEIDNMCSKGAYILRKSDGVSHDVDLWATGSEVSLACSVRDVLQQKGYGVRVISLPCWKLFEDQPAAYKDIFLKNTALKVAIEAASSFGWERYVGNSGLIFGINQFGASATCKDLYAFFGLTTENIVKNVITHLKNTLSLSNNFSSF